MLHNFSKLLEHSDTSAATIEAQKNIIHKVIDSKGQDSGWTKLEIFLLDLCSLFSKRCKNVSNTLTDVQHIICHFQDYVNADSGMEKIAQGIFKLYITSEIYRQLGATMSYRVETSSLPESTKSKLILSGQPVGSSTLPAAALDCEIDIHQDEAVVFKALAGDLLLDEHTTTNPYATEEKIEQYFDFPSLNETQTNLMKSLARMPTNDVKAIMSMIARTNNALKAVSAHIKEHLTPDIESLNSTTFHNIYGGNARYSMNDFLAVSLPMIKGIERMGRQIIIDQVNSELGKRYGLLEEKIENTDTQMKTVIQQGAENLEKQALDFAKSICAAIEGKSEDFNSEDLDNSLKQLPRSFRRKFKKCIKDCYECKQYDDFKTTAKSVSDFLASGMEIIQKKLENEQDNSEHQQNLLENHLKMISEVEKQQTNVAATIDKLEETLRKLALQKEEKTNDIERVKDKIKQIDTEIQKFNLQNESKRHELQNLESQGKELKKELDDYQALQKQYETEWCDKLKESQEKMARQSSQLMKVATGSNSLKSASVSVQKQTNNLSRYTENAFADIVFKDLAVTDTDKKEFVGMSVADLTSIKESIFRCQTSIIGLLNDISDGESYNASNFIDVLETEKLFTSEEQDAAIASVINKINGIRLPNRLVYINDDRLDSFLMKLHKKGISSLQNRFNLAKTKTEKAQIKRDIQSARALFSAQSQYVKNLLETYKDFQNESIKIIRDRSTVLEKKIETIDLLLHTVASMKCDHWDELESDVPSLDLDEVDYSSMPQEVCGLAKELEELYRSNINKLREEKNDIQSKIDRLLGNVLPKFAEFKFDETRGLSDIKYRPTFSNLEEKESLSEQDELDIKWALDVITSNRIKIVNKHQRQNIDYIQVLDERIKQCKQQGEALNMFLGEIAKETLAKLTPIDAKVKRIDTLIKENESQQRTVSEIININIDNIRNLDSDKSEQQKKIDSLGKEIDSLEKENQGIESKIRRLEKASNSITQRQMHLNTTVSNIQMKQSSIKEKIEKTRDLLQRLTSINKSDEICDSVNQNVRELENELKTFEAGKEFLSQATEFIGNGMFDSWVNKGHSVPETGEKEKYYNGYLFLNAKIPNNDDKEEGIKIWTHPDYQTTGDVDSAIRTDSVVVNDLFSVTEANVTIDKIQEKYFNQLFNIEDNQLVTDVRNSLKAFCGKTEPDFRSFKKFIAERYSAIQKYSHSFVKAESLTQAQSDDIMKLKEDLYKAQMLFGICMAATIRDRQMKDMCKNISIDVMAAGLRMHTFSQLYHNPIMNHDAKFFELLNEWEMVNSKEEDKDENKSLKQRIIDWMLSDNKQKDNKPIVNFLFSVIQHQRCFVNASFKTGRIMTRQQAPSDFAELSLYRLLWKGVDSNLTGTEFLFGLTDIAAGMRNPVLGALVTVDYSSFVKERENWVAKNENTSLQVSQACAAMDLRVRGILPTPEVSSAVA